MINIELFYRCKYKLCNANIIFLSCILNVLSFLWFNIYPDSFIVSILVFIIRPDSCITIFLDIFIHFITPPNQTTSVIVRLYSVMQSDDCMFM